MPAWTILDKVQMTPNCSVTTASQGRNQNSSPSYRNKHVQVRNQFHSTPLWDRTLNSIKFRHDPKPSKGSRGWPLDTQLDKLMSWHTLFPTWRACLAGRVESVTSLLRLIKHQLTPNYKGRLKHSTNWTEVINPFQRSQTVSKNSYIEVKGCHLLLSPWTLKTDLI